MEYSVEPDVHCRAARVKVYLSGARFWQSGRTVRGGRSRPGGRWARLSRDSDTRLYLVARRAGVSALKRVTPEKRDRIENLLGRYDLIAVMVPAVLPPPFPFKPFVLCAGVLRLKTWRFITAIFIGRSVRFLIEGWLAIRFGEDAGRIIGQHGWKVLVAVAVLAASGFTLSYFRARSRRSRELSVEELPGEQGPVAPGS